MALFIPVYTGVPTADLHLHFDVKFQSCNKHQILIPATVLKSSGKALNLETHVQKYTSLYMKI